MCKVSQILPGMYIKGLTYIRLNICASSLRVLFQWYKMAFFVISDEVFYKMLACLEVNLMSLFM